MTRETQIRLQVRYTGRVQGVGFRLTCASIASAHAVTGWVRNEHDGSVLLQALGAPAVVEGFLQAVSVRMESKISGSDRSALAAIPGETAFVIAR